LGLKVGTSQNIGLPELIGVLREFERDNSCHIGLSGFLTKETGRWDLEFAAAAWPQMPLTPEVAPLALVKRRCMESRLVTAEALVLQLLYSLDFALALREIQNLDATK